MLVKNAIIGITGNVSKGKSKDAWENGISRTDSSTFFSDIILEIGVPIILPIGFEQVVKDYVTMIDKLILTGGQHISPRFYGEKRSIKSDDYNEDRDIFESRLLMEMLKQNKPVLAICRGAQLVNVVSGRTLNQLISNHWQEEIPSQAHQSIRLSKNSVLFPIYGDSSQINSLHIQSTKELAPELEAITWDHKD
ncbi:peptidase [Streptococcus pseudoporcinus]|nr:peptidase [Streptococcus pseudoporcinus]